MTWRIEFHKMMKIVPLFKDRASQRQMGLRKKANAKAQASARAGGRRVTPEKNLGHRPYLSFFSSATDIQPKSDNRMVPTTLGFKLGPETHQSPAPLGHIRR